MTRRVRLDRKHDVYVGRPSKWGNPGLSLPAYRALVLATPRLRAALPELRGKILACWCLPRRPCHADILIELADDPLV